MGLVIGLELESRYDPQQNIHWGPVIKISHEASHEIPACLSHETKKSRGKVVSWGSHESLMLLFGPNESRMTEVS